MKKSKYLVRPGDMHIFEIEEYSGFYRSYFTRNTKNRPNAYEHFTYENLTRDYNFFPIEEKELEMYVYINRLIHDYMSWKYKSDGHGGIKEVGTFDEFLVAKGL